MRIAETLSADFIERIERMMSNRVKRRRGIGTDFYAQRAACYAAGCVRLKPSQNNSHPMCVSLSTGNRVEQLAIGQ